MPAKLWYKKEIDFSKFHIFGCDAYSLIPKKKRKHKCGPKSEPLRFVGVNPEGYRLLDVENAEIDISRDVRFNENSMMSDLNEVNRSSSQNSHDGEIKVNDSNNADNVTVDSNTLKVDQDSIDNLIIDDNLEACETVFSVIDNCPINVDDAKNTPMWAK